MMDNPEIDRKQLDAFERILTAGSSSRVQAEVLWRALARVFPHRTQGPSERRLLLACINGLEARGSVRLPPYRGRRWDRSLDPHVPTSIDLIRDHFPPATSSWRTFPWHARLQWVHECKNLSQQQIEFLQAVHHGLVHGTFDELAPLKYRSLQLTGDEKRLAALAKTSLFADDRLSFDLLGCLPDALPLAWEAVGDGKRLIIFENAGPFAVARRVLKQLEKRPYDTIAYGNGRSVVASLAYIKTLERPVVSIHYVGDLDFDGLDIAIACQKQAAELSLPRIHPATELHHAMLQSARAFGFPGGWSNQKRRPHSGLSKVLQFIENGLQDEVRQVLQSGCRIPEEVLGPGELRGAWSAASRSK